jgi:hypothetical protein
VLGSHHPVLPLPRGCLDFLGFSILLSCTDSHILPVFSPAIILGNTWPYSGVLQTLNSGALTTNTMAEAFPHHTASHEASHHTQSLPQRLDASSRTSSASSSGTELVGRLEPVTNFCTIAPNGTDGSNGTESAVENPPRSRTETPDDFDTDFDDNLLPASSHRPRRVSSPGAGGGEAKAAHASVRKRKSMVDGLVVSLEKIPSESGRKSRRYMLKVDDEVRELLLAGARERQGSAHRDGSKGRPRRGRFGDLVFARKSTTFDRTNSENRNNQFYGFFVLLW